MLGQMLRRRNLLVVLLAGVLLLAAACSSTDNTAEPSATSAPTGPAAELRIDGKPLDAPLAQGDKVPDWSAPGLDGGTVAWADRAGKPTVLTVWASWCPHCQVELPVLQKVSNDYPTVHVTSVTTAMGQQPGPTPKQYVSDNGITLPVAVDDEQLTLLKGLGVQSFPTLYFVNADGTIYAAAFGEVAESDLRTAFDVLAAQEPVAASDTESGPAVVELTVAGGKVTGDTETSVTVGTKVVVTVSADVTDEVHVHGYDVTGEVSPGKPAEIKFTADAPGRFEVELEGAGLPLAEITVTK